MVDLATLPTEPAILSLTEQKEQRKEEAVAAAVRKILPGKRTGGDLRDYLKKIHLAGKTGDSRSV